MAENSGAKPKRHSRNKILSQADLLIQKVWTDSYECPQTQRILFLWPVAEKTDREWWETFRRKI